MDPETTHKKMNKFSQRLYRFLDPRSIWDLLPKGCRHLYYEHIYPQLRPAHQRLHKAIPKEWRDTCELMVELNFAMIVEFYQQEYLKGRVDWQADESHKEFAQWLERTYQYISQERVRLEILKEKAYPPTPPFEQMFTPIVNEGKVKSYKMNEPQESYQELYGEVERLEKEIEEKDTEVLIEFVKRRGFFWT